MAIEYLQGDEWVSINLSMCDVCPHVHLNVQIGDEHGFSLGLTDDQWGELFKTHAMLSQTRGKPQ